MKRISLIVIFSICHICGSAAVCHKTEPADTFHFPVNEQDSLKDLQNLYTGKVWTNRYRNIKGDQFLFANYFLPGTVSSKGITYKNLLIKYDIFSDEILIPIDRQEIIQLNKEAIDSFSIKFNNRFYRFINIKSDTVSGLEEFKGFINVVLKEQSTLYVKFKKEILSSFKANVDVEFIQSQKIYLAIENNVVPVLSKNDLYKMLGTDIDQVKEYVKKSRLKVSLEEPESLIGIIRFCDNLNRK
jgi:hypothetical protein